MFDKKLLLQHIQNQNINTKDLNEKVDIPWDQGLMDRIQGKGPKGEKDPVYVKPGMTPDEAAANETTNRPSFLGRERPWEARGMSEDDYHAAVAAKKLGQAKFWDMFYKTKKGIDRPGSDVRAGLDPANVAPKGFKGYWKADGNWDKNTKGFSVKNVSRAPSSDLDGDGDLDLLNSSNGDKDKPKEVEVKQGSGSRPNRQGTSRHHG